MLNLFDFKSEQRLIICKLRKIRTVGNTFVAKFDARNVALETRDLFPESKTLRITSSYASLRRISRYSYSCLFYRSNSSQSIELLPLTNKEETPDSQLFLLLLHSVSILA
jgi:hypothetical protein